jgi:hypothetical protein
VILLGLDDDENNPLLAVPAFKDFQENLSTWIAGPPTIEQLTPRRVIPAVLTGPSIRSSAARAPMVTALLPPRP